MASIAENESKAVVNSNGRGGVHRMRMLNDSCLLQIFLYLSHVDEIVPRLLIVSKAWYKIIANSTSPVSTTGNAMHEGEEIPEVNTFPVSAYQRADLKLVKDE